MKKILLLITMGWLMNANGAATANNVATITADENAILIRYKELIARPPDINGRNVRVWTIRQNETIRINLVEMSGELLLHKHPDADHSLVILSGEVKVQIADQLTTIKAGDFVSVPANVPHKYWSLTPQSWLVSMDAPYYDPSKTITLE